MKISNKHHLKTLNDLSVIMEFFWALKFWEEHSEHNFVPGTKIFIELAMFAVIDFPDWWK